MQQSKLDNYASQRGADAYQADWQRKAHRRWSDRRERRIYAQFFAAIGRSPTLLDLPCGFGRLLDLLRGHAERVIEADWSPTMLGLNARAHGDRAAGYVRCSALQIPLPDRAVDTVVSVRLSHHFADTGEREQHLREVLRVARRWAIVTYFSHYSLKNLLRLARAPFDGKPAKNTLRTRRVDAIAREHGFRRVDAAWISRLSSGHVFALLARDEQRSGVA